MLIIWGSKPYRRRVGRMAGFCPLCRDLRPFRVEEVGLVGHLYYVPLGRKTPHGFVKTCEVCKLALEAGEEDLASADAGRRAEVEELSTQAHPAVAARSAGRLELEGRVRSRSITAQERAALIREPILLASGFYDERVKATQFDARSSLGCLSTILVPIIVGLAVRAVVPTADEELKAVLSVIAVVLGLFTLYSLHTDGPRYARRSIVPRLAWALRPLDPSVEELGETFGALSAQGVKLCKAIGPEDVRHALDLPAGFEV